MAVNALQVLEVLADDSNFRGMAMQLAAAPAAAALTLPPAAFVSAWCAGEACALLFMLRRILYASLHNIICLCSSARLLAAVSRCCSSGVRSHEKMSLSIIGCRHH